MYLNINDDYYNVDVTYDKRFDRYVVYYDNANYFDVTYFCNDGEYENICNNTEDDYLKDIIEHDIKERNTRRGV